MRHVFGWDRATLLTRLPGALAPEDQKRFEALLEERLRRRPLQHLLGEQEFWRRPFRVNADVLIPRPETEGLVEASLALLAGRPSPLVVDVGTGSGCIALSLAGDLPTARVHAIDLSPAALAVAADNARRLGLEGRVTFHRGDLLDPMRAHEGLVDLVASNPPYVDLGEAPSLSPEVRDHEPHLALFPPGDRALFYRRLAPEAARALAPGGFLVLEIGQGMADEVAGLLTAAGLALDEVRPDLQGIPRVVIAHRP